MDSQRVHAVRFNATEQSRHFMAFDSDVSLASRVEFLSITALLAETCGPSSRPAWQGVELRAIIDDDHPARGELALFATVLIPAKTVLGPYTGVIKVCQGMLSSRTYAMGFGSVNDEFVVDAEFAGGFARFANDPRNTGRTANTVAESRVSHLGESYTALVAKRTIAVGEEILMDYGKAFSLEPRPWCAGDRQVTRLRLAGALPLPLVGELYRECTTCGYCNKMADGSSQCYACGGPRATQHSRVIMVKGIAPHAAEIEPSPWTPRWPQGVAFLPWQVWDPLVPLYSQAPHIDFKQQEGLSLYEVHGDTQVVASKSYAAGDVVGYVGGVATFRSAAVSNSKLNAIDVSSLLGLPGRRVTLLVTNECQHVTRTTSERPANATVALRKEQLGYPYLALVALRAIEAFEEVIV